MPEFCFFRSHSSQPLAILVADHGGVIRRPEVESFLNVFSVEVSDVERRFCWNSVDQHAKPQGELVTLLHRDFALLALGEGILSERVRHQQAVVTSMKP